MNDSDADAIDSQAAGRRPALVIISGAPGTGKTSLANDLSGSLGLALLSKDMFKEGIYDHLPGVDTSDSHRLGIASIGMMYAFARRQLENGVGLILESTFDRGKAEDDVRPLLDLASAVIVHCRVPKDLLLKRYAERADSPDRHEVHRDEDQLGSLERNLEKGIYEPMDLQVPFVDVDMTDPDAIDVRDLIIRIRSILEDGAAHQEGSRR